MLRLPVPAQAITGSVVLSIITGGGKRVEMTIRADPLYQHLLLTAEKKFWRCVVSRQEPRLSMSSHQNCGWKRSVSSI